MYGHVLGCSTVTCGAATIAALPNTGGSRNVVFYVAVTSIVLGAAILASSLVRFVAKHHYTA